MLCRDATCDRAAPPHLGLDRAGRTPAHTPSLPNLDSVPSPTRPFSSLRPCLPFLPALPGKPLAVCPPSGLPPAVLPCSAPLAPPSSVQKKASPDTPSSPLAAQPLPPGTQRRTEAPDGPMLTEGLREAAAHSGPRRALEPSKLLPAQPPSWQRSRAQGQPPQHEASSLPSQPRPTQGGGMAPAEEQRVSPSV